MKAKITNARICYAKTLLISSLAIVCLLLTGTDSRAQLLQWNTFGNAGTETTEPSIANDANIAGPVNLTIGAGVTATANGNRFGGSGWFDTGNTAGGNTLTEAVAGNNYIQFIVTPNAGISFTPTSLIFTWDRSSTGPSSVTLRSSADGFVSDLGTVTGMVSGGAATTTSRTITITTLTNISVATTFRLYGYGSTATTGTGGFDNATSVVDVQLNGTTTSLCTSPVLAINATTTTCAGSTNGAIDLNVSGGTSPFTYLWNNGATTEDITGVAAGNYTVTVTSTGGCAATISATVNAIALPVVSFSGLPTSICVNAGTITLTGNQAPSGTFSGTGITDNANGTATFSPATATVGGPYAITYSYTDISTSCSNSISHAISVNDAPNIASITAVSNTCPTVSFDLSTIALTNSGAAGTSTYFSSLNDANNNINSISSTVSATGTYFIRVTTVAGCFDVESVAVTIISCGCANPPSSNAGSNFSSCANVNAPLNGSIGGGATSATWSGGAGTFIPNATTLNASYTPTTGELTTGFVTLTLTTDDPDGAGSCVAAVSSVTISFLSVPSVAVNPTTATICAGSSTGNLVANGASTYSWTPNDGSLSATTGSTVIATPIATTTYTVTGAGANGCFNTATVIVNINALPSINTDLAAATICNGASTATITANGGVSYSWSPELGLNVTAGAAVIASPLVSTTYTVTGTDANGCSATSTVAITVNPKPTVSISGNGYACSGSSTVLDAGSGFIAYNWSTGATTESISINTNGTFTVTVTDANGCANAASKSVVITVPPTVSAVATESTCNNSLPGTIDLTATGGTPCNTNAKGLIISKISANPSGNDSPFEFVELLATKNIDFSVTPYSVVFANNGAASNLGWKAGANLTYAFEINTGTAVAGGVYSVGGSQMPTLGNRLRDINTGTTGGDGSIGLAASGGVLGNGGTSADAVAVFDLPVATITSATVPLDAIFYGNAIGSSAIAGGTQGYQLPINDKYAGGKLLSSSFLLPDSFALSNYIVEATGTYDIQSNIFTTSRTFVYNPLALFSEGVSAITLTNIPAYLYNWSNSATTEDLGNLTAGTYTVTVTDCNGCSATISKTVSNVASPIVSFTGLPTAVCANANAITITGNNAPSGTFTGTGITDNMDGTASFNPTTAGAGGPYSITYSYTDPSTGCTANQSQNITVNGLPDIQTISGVTNNCPTPTVDLSAIALVNNGVTGTSTYFGTLSNANNNNNSISPVVNATGTYYIRVTTVSGCYDVEPITVTINGCGCANPPTASAGSNFPICANESAQLNGSIGGGATSLTWSGGAGSFNPNNTIANATYSPTAGEITAGTVTLTITTDDPDGAGACVAASSSVTITINALPVIALNTNTIAICSGSTSGDIIASGASTYSWSPGNGLSATTGNTVTANPISTTTYTVTGTDINGCSNSAIVVVSINALPVIGVTPANPSICIGNSVGLVASNAINYSWANATGLSATTGNAVTANPIATTIYTVTGTDANSCSSSTTVEVIVNDLPVVSISGGTIICSGSSTTLNAGNGFPSYLWSNGATSQTITTSITGTYTVTVANSNGCSNSASTTLTVSAPPTLSATAVPSSCNTNAPGSIALTVSGGAPCAVNSAGLVISKVLANPAGTDSPFEFVELVATKNIDFSVTPYSVIFSNNGTATANGWKAGAAITYGFQINTGTAVAGSVYYVGGSTMIPVSNRLRVINTGTTAGDGGLGNFNTTGVLGNGGTVDGIAVFNSSIASITAATVPVDAFFYGTSIGTALVSGGTQGYQLPVNDMYSGGKLQASSYFGPDPVTPQYCNATGTYNALTNTFTTPRTFANTASFTEGVSGVTVITAAPYTYSWSNGMTTQNISGLTAGTYTVTVTDCNGCSSTLSQTVTNTPNPTVIISGGLTFCSGNSTNLDAGAYEGYSWSTGETTQTISVNTAGTFTVTVTNTNGCSASGSVTTIVNSLPTPSINGTLAFCTGNSTTLDAGSYSSYSWSTGATTQTISVNTAETFTVTVTNVNGCTASAAATTTVNTLPTASINGTLTFCAGSSTTLDAGGSIPFAPTTIILTYAWSTGETTQTISVNTASTFTVTVTNANGCTASASATTTVNPLPTASCSHTDVSCSGSTNGTASVITGGGNSTFTYLWNDANSQATATATGLAAGVYTVTVTSDGCTTTCSTTVGTVVDLTSPNISCPTDISCVACITPIGFIRNTTLNCTYIVAGTEFDATGNDNCSAVSFTWSASGATSSSGSGSMNGVALNNGFNTITWTASDASGNTSSCSLTIEVQDNIAPIITCPATANVFANNVGCSYNGTIGTATATDNCGTASISGPVPAGPYSLGSTIVTWTATDAAGNTSACTQTVTVSNPATANITPGGPTTFCEGGSVVLTNTPSGSSYLWSDGQTGDPITVTVSGNYTVIHTDANGCTATAGPVTVTVNELPTPSISGVTTFCAGSATLLDAGLFSGYSWSTGETTQTISVNTAGTFTVTVTNQNGCSASASASTIVNPAPNSTINGTTGFCSGSSSILSANTGYANYLWSTGATINSVSVNTAGLYSVLVTDVLGCTSSSSVSVTVYSNPTPVITGQNLPCNGSPAILDAGLYSSYVWSTGATTQTISTNTTGTFTVTVTNANACIGTASYAVNLAGNAPGKPATMTGSFTANCVLLNMTYSCSTVANSTSYFWTVPVGVKIISGQGSTSIVVNYTPAFTSNKGVITVAAVNSCGMSAALKRNTSSRLNTPLIVGTNAMCPNDIKTYSVSPVAGAINYTWTKVTGSTILSGQGTTSVTIKWGAVGGIIKCTANNACGASVAATHSVSIVCAKVAGSVFDFSEINLYPNPASTSATLQFDAYADGKGLLTVYDLVGQQVLSKPINLVSGNNQFVLDLASLPKGIYSVSVDYNNMVRNQKLVVQ